MKEIEKDIRDLRTDYVQSALDKDSVASEPLAQFEKWMEEAMASEILDANAMSLGTVDENGQPKVRIMLLRGFDEAGFVFYTNYGSQKGREINHSGKAALTFFWPELQRQLRIEGQVQMTAPEVSDLYFESRPRASQLGAWASPQSENLDSRDRLTENLSRLQAKFEGKEVHRPPHWGGYVVKPERIEFWQGRASRLHDRIEYRRQGDNWTIARLAP